MNRGDQLVSEKNENNTDDHNMKDETASNHDAKDSSQENVNFLDLKAQAEKNKNDYLYLRAEFENYKKHAIKERSDLLKFGAERVMVELLNVLDNFERALETKATAENLNQYVKGIELTANELKSVLNKFGVSEVESLGKNFDPQIHEALSSEETTEFSPGQISRVFKKPYKLHDKVIRPGQVVVAKQKA